MFVRKNERMVIGYVTRNTQGDFSLADFVKNAHGATIGLSFFLSCVRIALVVFSN